MKSISFIFLFAVFSLSAQEEKKHSFGAGLSLTKMDFFLQGNYQIQFQKVEFSAGLGVGIIRSFFQGRIFPQATLRSTYYFLDKSNIQLGPTISLNYSGVKLNNQVSKVNFWQQYCLGYCLTIGNRLKFVQITEVGPQLETYFTEFEQHYKTVGTFGYSLQIGLRYGL